MTAAVSPGDGRFTALVMAGRRPGPDALAESAGVSHRCLVRAGGVPMLGRVVSALAHSPSVGRIAVSIDEPEVLSQAVELAGVDEDRRPVAVPCAETPSRSVLRAVEEMPATAPLLVTTADHALLTPALVERFCAEAVGSGAQLAAGVSTASVIQAAYPGTRRTYLRFREGGYSGCNLYAVLEEAGLRAVAFWGQIERERKRPWRMALALGPVLLIRYLLGRLSLADAARHISSLTGVDCRAVVLPVAEAAIDVDKPEDLALVEAILQQRP